jgi:large subunit ribosomal protein L29
MMKAKQYREMSGEERKEKLQDLQKQLFTLRTQAVTEKVENFKGAGNVRKDIARIKTIMREAKA